MGEDVRLRKFIKPLAQKLENKDQEELGRMWPMSGHLSSLLCHWTDTKKITKSPEITALQTSGPLRAEPAHSCPHKSSTASSTLQQHYCTTGRNDRQRSRAWEQSLIKWWQRKKVQRKVKTWEIRWGRKETGAAEKKVKKGKMTERQVLEDVNRNWGLNERKEVKIEIKLK